MYDHPSNLLTLEKAAIPSQVGDWNRMAGLKGKLPSPMTVYPCAPLPLLGQFHQ